MQIILDFEDWLEESDSKTATPAKIRKFSDWLKKRNMDVISDFRSEYIKEYLEYLLVREDKQAVIRALKSFNIFLEFLKSICILEKMGFKPEWLERVIKEEFSPKT